MEKLKITKPIIVEGKYDKIKLDSILDAKIITTKGFGVFSSQQTKDFLRKLCLHTPLIVLTDSDSAGRMIRNHLRSFLPADRLINIYIPDITGKEKRKKAPSKAGTLGVEGIDADLLRSLLLPFAEGKDINAGISNEITKAHLYEDGLLGGSDSKAKRYELAKKLSLPKELSSSAFLDALNMLCTYEQYKELLK